jgi:flagellum-specific ATP synthase
VLSRDLAQANHYPAIDVLQSISRLAPVVSGKEAGRAAGVIRRHMAVYRETEDLINVGAYHGGSNPAVDEAIAKHRGIEDFLIQEVDEKTSMEETLQAMAKISGVETANEAL